MTTLVILVGLVGSLGASAPSPAAPAFRALVVAANDRFHGAMSDAAEPLLESLGAESGFAVHFTHDATVLRDEELARHEVVVQLHLAPFDMTKDQQDALQRFILRGGGWVGIHAAEGDPSGSPRLPKP